MYQRLCSLAAVIIFLSGAHLSLAQSKDLLNDENLMKAVLQQSSFSIDTGAQAVVLYEQGQSILESYHLVYKIERIVKIIGQEGVEHFSAVNIPSSQSVSSRKIKAETYNLENGIVAKQSIEKTDVLSDKTTKDASTVKFNLPSVKPGSVVHYTYILEGPGFMEIPDWNFQSSFPTLYSEYQTKTPAYLTFTPITNAAIPFKQVKSERELNNCEAGYLKENFSIEVPTFSTWVRRNVQAFKREPYMSGEDNYLERVKLHILSINPGVHAKDYDVYSNWNKVTENLYKNEKVCGQVFRPNNFLNDQVKHLTDGKKDNLEKAKAIFSYVRDSIKLKQESYNDYLSLYDINDVYKRREGNIRGINLLLVAMLRNADLNSEPVILSTRSQEHLDPIMPNPYITNYTVAVISIDNKDYFLDAASKYMPFGVLPSQCYNGYCRIISKTPAAVELRPDDLLDKNIVMVTLLPAEKVKDKLVLKVDQKFGDVSAADLRNEYNGDSTKLKEKILKDLTKLSMPASLVKYSFSNLYNADEPLTVHYEALLNWDANIDMIYLDPYFDKLYDQNPLSAATRKYPIEMDHRSDIKYIFRFQLPADYVVDDFPKSRIINLGNDELIQLKNMMTYDAANKVFNLECRYTEKTTVFPPESYTQLRTFNDNIIDEQRKKIVLKKIN